MSASWTTSSARLRCATPKMPVNVATILADSCRKRCSTTRDTSPADDFSALFSDKFNHAFSTRIPGEMKRIVHTFLPAPDYLGGQCFPPRQGEITPVRWCEPRRKHSNLTIEPAMFNGDKSPRESGDKSDKSPHSSAS